MTPMTNQNESAQPTRLPTYFISHGGGPWPWIKDLVPWNFNVLERSLKDLPRELPVAPKAILAISGHWETKQLAVQASPHPPMLYDYSGFPEFTFHLKYPAPGDPALARRVQQLLTSAGFPTDLDADRGYDHGVFAPFYVMYPEARMPIVQLSLRADYDPAAHLAMGRALAPLRSEGVLIVGSGLSYHNFRNAAGAAPSKEFDSWLTETLCQTPLPVRSQKLVGWSTAPSARLCHPQEDHLIPLMVAVGAAEDESGTRTYHEETLFGVFTASAYRFGTV
jgi:aromatic ring-opening dioxygenase catalytic subunit (LigB family)